MMHELTILSIFRQSQSYLPRYFRQVEQAFAQQGKGCHAIWLEGDSTDETYQMLCAQKLKFEQLGHRVSLVKYDLKGPFWSHSVNDPHRWHQLASCWTKCMEALLPSKITVCVESDLIWESSVIDHLISKLNDQRQVICPMLMTEKSIEFFGMERFYDSWGFSRGGKKFTSLPPYWEFDASLMEDADFVEVTTGGGMIVTTYDVLKHARWSFEDCILRFPKGIRVFLDKNTRIYHPVPEKWKNISTFNRLLRIIKYRSIVLGKSLKKRVVT